MPLTALTRRQHPRPDYQRDQTSISMRSFDKHDSSFRTTIFVMSGFLTILERTYFCGRRDEAREPFIMSASTSAVRPLFRLRTLDPTKICG
jgi:hypothetical protein